MQVCGIVVYIRTRRIREHILDTFLFILLLGIQCVIYSFEYKHYIGTYLLIPFLFFFHY